VESAENDSSAQEVNESDEQEGEEESYASE